MSIQYLMRGLALAAAFAAGGVQAQQAYPSQTVQIIVPFSPGGNIDIATRLLGTKLSERFGQTFVVMNRPGAGGSIGAEAVARAAPDGNTILSGSNGMLAVNPAVNDQLGYDPLESFTPVGLISRVPLALTISAKLPAKTYEEFLAYAATKPDGVMIGSSGAGGAQHLAIAQFANQAGIPFVHVPYKGGSAVLPDLIAGNIDAALNELPNVLPNHKDGKVRIIAIAADQRSKLLPDVPTLDEAGLKGFTAYSSNGWLLPAKTPQDVVDTLQTALVESLQDPAVRARFEDMGLIIADPAETSPDGYRAIMQKDLETAKRVAQEHNIRVGNN